jgi:hypothetical protein
MNNAAFAKLKPVYLEHKKLGAEIQARDAKIAELSKRKDGLPDSYYENPNAFILAPEFNNETNTLQQRQFVLNHWNEQLIAMGEGAKEIQYLDHDGKQFITKTIPVDGIRTEKAVESYVRWAEQQVGESRGRIQSMAQTHAQAHANAVKELQSFDGKFFSWFDRPANKPIFEPVIQQQLNNIPVQFRASPVAQTLARSLALNTYLATILQKVQTNQQSGATAKPAARRSGPTTGEIAGDGAVASNKKDAEVDFDMFNKVKDGY